MNRADLTYLAKRTLRRWGWHVERAAAGGWQPNRTYWEPAYLERWGLRPRTLIDVGVGHGTPHLYDAFPDARLVLVEPLAEFAPAVARILARRPGVHVAAAAGAASGTRTVHVEPRFLERSSFFDRHALEVTGDRREARTLPVRTLDAIVAEHAPPGPFGLKIDTEGAELDVIRGATETLRATEFVIAEVSVLPRFAGSYAFADFVAAMADAGFGAFDVLGVGRADASDVTFLDLAFRRVRA